MWVCQQSASDCGPALLDGVLVDVVGVIVGPERDDLALLVKAYEIGVLIHVFLACEGRPCQRQLFVRRQRTKTEMKGRMINTCCALGSDLSFNGSPGDIATSYDVEDLVFDSFRVDDFVELCLDVLQEGFLALLLATEMVVLAHDFDVDIVVHDGDETFVVVAKVVEYVLDLMRGGVGELSAVGRHDAERLDSR